MCKACARISPLPALKRALHSSLYLWYNSGKGEGPPVMAGFRPLPLSDNFMFGEVMRQPRRSAKEEAEAKVKALW